MSSSIRYFCLVNSVGTETMEMNVDQIDFGNLGCSVMCCLLNILPLKY